MGRTRLINGGAGVLMGLAIAYTGICEDVWAFGFSVEPARVELAIPAGKRRGKTVTVRNARSDASIHLTIYSRDVAYLPDGTNEFPAPGSTAWSCASWIQAVPQELDLAPGESHDVRVSVAVPADASGGRYAMLFFETTPSYTEKGIGVNFRVGALVEVVVPQTQRPQMKLTDLSLTESGGVRVELLNEGNVLVRPSGTLKVFDANGKPIRHAALNPSRLGVLPMTSRAFLIALDRPFPPGRYRFKVEIDYGTRTLLVGELPVEVQ